MGATCNSSCSKTSQDAGPPDGSQVRQADDEAICSRKFKVCVCGGAGGIGQPLCMLMVQNPHVGELCIFDLSIAMVPPSGVGADLSHLDQGCKVSSYTIDKDERAIDKLEECLSRCDLVLVPAGLPRKPGMTRSDLLGINAGIAKGIVEACAKFCPQAVLGLIVNPVNSVVPAMCELYKRAGLDPRKILGVTTLDIVRANKFLHELTGVPLKDIDVPVIGGHAGASILPVFSQAPAAQSLSAEQLKVLDKQVQDAGTVVVDAKGGKGSATLSMAYAGARFASAVLSGLAGVEVTQCVYMTRDPDREVDLPYFAGRATFGKGGVKELHQLGDLSTYERERLQECLKQLRDEIDAGMEYAKTTELAKA